jgi:hypothetical protein
MVKTVIHHCLTCYRFMVQASQQLTGELWGCIGDVKFVFIYFIYSRSGGQEFSVS